MSKTFTLNSHREAATYLVDLATVQGQRFYLVVNGAAGFVDRTFCSSSTFAGVITPLSNFSLAKDRATPGLLNPLLYATPMRTLILRAERMLDMVRLDSALELVGIQ
ncbi:hypothetical protein GYMLUDRAFT_260506 [Collybiopsis luxurians FD-317 M1]|uniref:Uncharacterized protein n=1 Tax=Collybiopsis luxurians FD-317 M1 TaxID=944289 RepID=A0A0D0CH35_9AGAR|nr:hypothetical protein GYMLUDRAFT_260506 [Collybiopsis luxurians FD-317 M1]